jgi:hypothetical protein
MKLLSYEHFQTLNESVQKFEQDLNEVLNEDLAAALKNPINYTKIKNNAKKYQKALVQQSLNDVDLEKKKQASRSQGEATGTLTAANRVKNDALRDIAAGISNRMDDLASDAILQKVVQFAKTKAKLAAAEIALKSADETESKALKVRIKNLNQTAADASNAIRDYESEESDEAPDSSR